MSTWTQLPVDLAAMRQQKGVTLEQISQTTKIRSSWLRAIEEGRWNELPGGVYRRSYARQYAQEAGIDAQALLARIPVE